MTEITSLACGGSRSPSSFLWLRSPCSSQGAKQCLRLEARQATGADRNWCKWPSSGPGHRERSSLQALWLGQARAAICCQPGSRTQATPAARCSWASSWLKGISCRRWSHLAPLSLLPRPPSQLQNQGFQGCVSKGPCCTVLLAWGFVAWNGHLVCLNPHSQGICGPMELSGKCLTFNNSLGKSSFVWEARGSGNPTLHTVTLCSGSSGLQMC